MPHRRFWMHYLFNRQWILIGLVTLIAVFFLLTKLDLFFSIKKITVVDQVIKRQLIGLSKFQRQNLLLFRTADAEKTLLMNNAQLQTVIVQKKYPDQLVIYPNWSNSLVQLKVAAGFFLLDESSKINLKKKAITHDLPVINYYQLLNYSSYQSGEIIDFSDIKTTLFLLNKLRSAGLFVNSVDINGADMIALDLGQKKLIFSSEKDVGLQWQQMWEIYKQFRISGKEFRRLDFRYDRPIIELPN